MEFHNFDDLFIYCLSIYIFWKYVSWGIYCRAKLKCSICLLYKWADTVFWLCKAVYAPPAGKGFPAVYLVCGWVICSPRRWYGSIHTVRFQAFLEANIPELLQFCNTNEGRYNFIVVVFYHVSAESELDGLWNVKTCMSTLAFLQHIIHWIIRAHWI